MKAGRELDALVAEHVMGSKPINKENIPIYSEDSTLNVNGSPVPCLKAYSTNISDAMEVWEKLRSSGDWCCLGIISDYNFCWTIRLTRSEQKGGDHSKPEIVVDGHEYLPLAICITALKSKGVIE